MSTLANSLINKYTYAGLEEGVVGAQQPGEGKHGVPGSVHALLRQLVRGVPDQVSNTVEPVVEERVGAGGLGQHLSGNGQRRESAHNRGSREGDVENQGGGVGASQRVEGAGQSHTGDSVQRQQDPGELGLVDLQVGRHGPVGSLGGQDLFLHGGVVPDGLDGAERRSRQRSEGGG